MKRPLRLGVSLLVLAAGFGVRPQRAAAQVDTTRRPFPPVLQSDSARADSIRRDTALTEAPRVFVATLPAPVVTGPLGLGSRFIFDTDSLRLSGAVTLADLLIHVPGVFVARGGFYGQAEPVLYGGRGAAGIEVYWDGVPYRPLGRDSAFLDLGRIPIAPLERVEVIRLPDRLRVDLITSRAGDTAPRTAIGITTGEQDIADYRAAFSRRWRSGLGVSLLADFNSLGGDQAATTGFHANDLWLKLELVPSPRLGASYQVLRTNWRRDGRANLVDPWKTSRYDGTLRLFAATRADGLGWRIDGTLTSAEASGDSATGKDGVTRGGVEVATRWSRGSMTLAARLANDVVQRDVEWRAGWLPLPGVDVGVSARYLGYLAGRHGTRVGATAGLRLPLGFSLHADVTSAHDLAAPRFVMDSARSTLDWRGAVRWDTRWAALEVSRAERDAFAPLSFPRGIRSLALLGPTPRTTEVTVHGTVRPLPGVELSGWYADPIRGGGDFELPRHARYAATFFSRFWRVYKSGVFALRGEIAAESWSRGLGGVARDSLGTTSQMFLDGATFLDMNVEIQIVGVTIFWQMRNATAMRSGYVSGLEYPGIVQFYGARWSFLN